MTSSAIRCPTLLIAAPASGQGKTTLTSALARWHTRRGLRVCVFKCGPDFLDPYWHALASGREVYQLDLWMTGEADIRQRLHAAAQQADLILIEGVMGLFDGEPSAADLAEKFNLPVLTVIDASAMAGTFGALAYGLKNYRPQLRWAGVLANRVASKGHAHMLQNSVRTDTQWLGAVMRSDALTLPERHLGLTVAAELPDALQRLDAAADALTDTPLGQMSVADLQAWSVTFNNPSIEVPRTKALAGKTIAVARDAAFCFIYQANLDVLVQLGATLVFFSPLADATLPACDALWLPGGYPELHATVLSNNHSMRESIQQHVARHQPVWAECGGMMVLFDAITLQDNTRHSMWGLLPGQVTMQARVAAIGPHQLVVNQQTLRGHTFHYATTDTPLVPATHTSRASSAPDAGDGEAVYQQGPIKASYFHAWFASNLEMTAWLFTG